MADHRSASCQGLPPPCTTPALRLHTRATGSVRHRLQLPVSFRCPCLHNHNLPRCYPPPNPHHHHVIVLPALARFSAALAELGGRPVCEQGVGGQLFSWWGVPLQAGCTDRWTRTTPSSPRWYTPDTLSYHYRPCRGCF